MHWSETGRAAAAAGNVLGKICHFTSVHKTEMTLSSVVLLNKFLSFVFPFPAVGSRL